MSESIQSSGPYFTVEEAAAELGVTRARVHQLIKAGSLSARKFGRMWQISRFGVSVRRKAMRGGS